MTPLIAILLAALTTLPSGRKPPQEIRNIRISSPKVLLSREKSDSDVQVTGMFKVDMTFANKGVKRPAARLVCLCELDGVLWMGQKLFDRPDSITDMRSAVYGSPDLDKGFFRMGKSATMPKLVLFRIEILKDGETLAQYESSHTGLSQRKLPDDWHVWKKYPEKFKYASM